MVKNVLGGPAPESAAAPRLESVPRGMASGRGASAGVSHRRDPGRRRRCAIPRGRIDSQLGDAVGHGVAGLAGVTPGEGVRAARGLIGEQSQNPRKREEGRTWVSESGGGGSGWAERLGDPEGLETRTCGPRPPGDARVQAEKLAPSSGRTGSYTAVLGAPDRRSLLVRAVRSAWCLRDLLGRGDIYFPFFFLLVPWFMTSPASSERCNLL